jgi:hypothetical protein
MNLRSILIACLAAAQGARAEPVKIACFGDSVVEAENDCNDASPYGPYAVGVISLGTNDAKKQNLPSKTTFIEEYKILITNIVEDLWDVGSDLKQLVLCSAVPIADEPISQTNKGDWNEASKKWVKHLCGN